MATWKDITSYSRGEKDRVPRTWECNAGYFRIVVTRTIYSPDQWHLNCRGLFDYRPLDSVEIEDAKAEALGIFAGTLREALKEVE